MRSLANLKENKSIIYKLLKRKVIAKDLFTLLTVLARYGVKYNLLPIPKYVYTHTHSHNTHMLLIKVEKNTKASLAQILPFEMCNNSEENRIKVCYL